MNSNKYFLLFGNCVPVKGVNRSLICDLYRYKYYYIPNDIYDVLESLKVQKVEIFFKDIDEDNKNIINDYLDYLVEIDVGFYTESPESFPQISMNWDVPSQVQNAILDFSSWSLKNISHYVNFLKKISTLNCKAVQFRFYCDTSLADISTILNGTIDSRIYNVNLISRFNQEIISELEAILTKHRRITSWTFYASPKNTFEKLKNVQVSYTTVQKISPHNCGSISRSNMVLTIGHFTEAQMHSTCLNRKISVDETGNIKNCPSCEESFGNILVNYDLKSILEDRNFTKYWNINKDIIDICKHCEYRYICMDCRAYRIDNKNIKSKPLKCGYDPFSNKWEDWSNNALKKSDGIVP